jgi:hypothetical protein
MELDDAQKCGGDARPISLSCPTFARRDFFGWCCRSMFSAADPLPAGSLTLSFKFRLFARRLASGVNAIGPKSSNLLSFGTTQTGETLYFDLLNEAFDLPAPGGYSSGWHQVIVSFDSATGVLQAYFDGQLGVNKTGFKQGKHLAGTFGPGHACPRLAAEGPSWA